MSKQEEGKQQRGIKRRDKKENIAMAHLRHINRAAVISTSAILAVLYEGIR